MIPVEGKVESELRLICDTDTKGSADRVGMQRTGAIYYSLVLWCGRKISILDTKKRNWLQTFYWSCKTNTHLLYANLLMYSLRHILQQQQIKVLLLWPSLIPLIQSPTAGSELKNLFELEHCFDFEPLTLNLMSTS